MGLCNQGAELMLMKQQVMRCHAVAAEDMGIAPIGGVIVTPPVAASEDRRTAVITSRTSGI
jgi:hypothetical protein